MKSNYDIDLIKALQKNEKPFGLMSEKMQAKAKELGKNGYFSCFDERDWTFIKADTYPFIFKAGITYQLRSEYEEPKPEMVECKVNPPDSNGQMWVQREDNHTMDFGSCVGHKDFIGFKYEGSDDIINSPRMYLFNGKMYHEIMAEHIRSGKAKVLTPTAVLFQVTK